MNKKCILGVSVTALVVAFDQFCQQWFSQHSSVIIGGGFVSSFIQLRYDLNSGIAFGFPLPVIAAIIFSIFIIGVLLWMLRDAYRAQKSFVIINSLVMIIGGALSNLFDRIYFGYVIDYIDVPWFTVFNLADALITLGVIGLVISAVFEKPLDKRNKIG